MYNYYEMTAIVYESSHALWHTSQMQAKLSNDTIRRWTFFSHKTGILLITPHFCILIQNNCMRQQSIQAHNPLIYEQWSLSLRWQSLRQTQNDLLPGIIAQSFPRFLDNGKWGTFSDCQLLPKKWKRKKRQRAVREEAKRYILGSLSFHSVH